MAALIAGAAMAGGSLGAQTNSSVSPNPLPSLSLPAAQQLAFERNWDLLAARSDVDIATAQGIVAHEFPNPTVSLSVAKISTDSAHPNQGGSLWQRDYDSIAAISQLFEIGGKRRSRQISAQAGLEGARARLLDAKRTLDLGVATAYAAAVQARENVHVLRESAASLLREEEIAKVRLNAGDISAADKNRIEITARQFELDAESAEATARTALVNLELLLGISHPNGEIVLTDDLEQLAQVQVSTEGITPESGRPDLVAAEQDLKKAEADLRLQKAERIPDPTILFQYEHEPPDTPNTIGLGVSFPLPLWNRNRGAISAAAASREQARIQIDKVKAQIAADIAIAKLNYQSALNRWVKYHDQLGPRSREIRDTVSFAYAKGGASLLDLLSAERDDNTVRLAALQAANDTVAAAAALKAATTVMPQSPAKP